MGVLVGLIFAIGVVSLVNAINSAPRVYKRPAFIEKIIRARTQILFGFLSSIGAFFLAYVMSKNYILASVVGVVACFVPSMMRRSQLKRKRSRLRQEWPDTVDDIVSALRAGLSIGEALSVQSERASEHMRPFFGYFAREYQASGRLGDALNVLKKRMDDPVADKIIEAMRMSHDVGGYDLGTNLTSVATSLRKENQARGELLARQSWTVGGAKVAAIAPWVVLALLSGRPGFTESFTNSTGTLILLGGFVATVCAYIAMLYVGSMPEAPRVLGGEQ